METQFRQGTAPEVEASTTRFQPIRCYDSVRAEVPDYDVLYCTGNVLIMVASFLNTVILIYLLVLHFKVGSRQKTYKDLMTKVKTWILILLAAFQLIVFIRYTVYFDGHEYDTLFII